MALTTSKLLHLADLHLGQETSLEQLGEIQTKIMNICSFSLIDVVLIAGDLFDNSRLGDEFIAKAIDIILGFGPPVVIVPGNHDCYEGDSPYKRIDPLLSGNGCLHIIDTKDGESLSFGSMHIWGKPVIAHDGDNRPLENISGPQKDKWNVAVAHGHLHRGAMPSIYSSIITPEEISNSGYHYIALGHWHFYCDVSCGDVTAFYSGSPFGPTLSGEGGTLVLATFTPGKKPIIEPIKLIV